MLGYNAVAIPRSRYVIAFEVEHIVCSDFDLPTDLPEGEGHFCHTISMISIQQHFIRLTSGTPEIPTQPPEQASVPLL